MNIRSVHVRLSFVGVLAVGVLLAACVGDDPVSQLPHVPPNDGAAADDAPTLTTTTTDADAADGGNEASAAKRFCDTQAPLTGVTDFFCADFDGTRVDEGFADGGAIIPDGGALIRATDIFYSPPSSLVPSNGATLFWEKAGATAFAEMSVRFRVNVGTLGGVVPPATGYVHILTLASVDTQVRISFTRGGTVEGADYTGYYLEASTCPNACARIDKKIPTPLPINVWTNIGVVWTKAGLVKISFNDIPVFETTAFGSVSTKVSAKLGLDAIGDAPAMPRHAFDNLVVSVKRE